MSTRPWPDAWEQVLAGLVSQRGLGRQTTQYWPGTARDEGDGGACKVRGNRGVEQGGAGGGSQRGERRGGGLKR